MSEIDPFMMPESPLDLDFESLSEPREREMGAPGLHLQEEIDAMKLAAAEFDGGVTVETFDPSDVVAFRRYAVVVSNIEHERYWSSHHKTHLPRTPEDIERDRQSFVADGRLVPTIIRRCDGAPSSSDFWDKWQKILEVKKGSASQF